MTNAEWMIKNGYKFSDLCCCFDDITGDIIISLYGIILARGRYILFDDLLKRWLDKDCKEHEEEPKAFEIALLKEKIKGKYREIEQLKARTTDLEKFLKEE